MKQVYQICRFICVMWSLSISSTALAKQPALQLKILPQPQTLAQLIALQATLDASKDPKQLSAQPYAVCFYANISEFIPSKEKDIKPIYGCVFSDQVAMNAALLRAGLYVHTTMGMADDTQLFTSNLMNAVGGHDFDGKDLVRYANNAEVPATTAAEHQKLKSMEAIFDEQVIKPLIQKHAENFIFFAIINTANKYKANMTHELLHAQYYNVPAIRPILLKVWNQVTLEDQTTIIQALQAGGYDMQQQELLLREFYSYFLQNDATNYLDAIKVLKPMASLATKYASKIKAALKQNGITALAISSN